MIGYTVAAKSSRLWRGVAYKAITQLIQSNFSKDKINAQDDFRSIDHIFPIEQEAEILKEAEISKSK